MTIAVLTIKLRAEWAHSLKEKRMEVKSLTARIKNKFNVSVSEIGSQDLHQIIELGVAAITADTAQADSVLDHVLNFIEANTQAQVLEISREMR